jgi:hypothetical protein
MDILIVTTASQLPLADGYFRATLPETAGFTVRERALRLDGAGTFESHSWQSGVTAKLRWVLEYMGSTPAQTVFALSDVDIQFFPGISSAELARTLEDSGADVLFQKEHRSTDSYEVNTGFYVARNTAWFREIVEQALALCDSADVKNDQTAMNELLSMEDLGSRWGFLPFTYYARSQGFPPPGDIVLHHANFSGSVPEKIAQLRRVRGYVNGGTTERVRAIATESVDFVTSGKLIAGWRGRLREVARRVRT